MKTECARLSGNAINLFLIFSNDVGYICVLLPNVRVLIFSPMYFKKLAAYRRNIDDNNNRRKHCCDLLTTYMTVE